MLTLNVFTSLMGACLAGAIVWLVRRGHLHASSALFWLCVALITLIFGLWPGLIDRLAAITGIAYPPALLLLCGLAALLIKHLDADIQKTHLETEIRRINQKITMLELQKISELESKPQHISAQQ